ncbi:MAG: GNAT family N-acetyltransferase [Clostridiales bacterium]|jgi:ribosomal-protein-alanine N-acetyltransferase|nr:GNAT family N-acetyltransferase [Clostridiales bacterium]
MTPIRLRPWNLEDASSLQKYANNPAIAGNLRDAFPEPYTLEDAQAFIQSCQQSNPKTTLCYAIEVNRQAVGSIGLFVQQDVYCKSAEIGYWVGQPFWRQGIMTQAIRQICEEGFATMDIVRIYAQPFARNFGSQTVLEKNGFQLEGTLRNSVYKHGELQDSYLYALLKPGC